LLKCNLSVASGGVIKTNSGVAVTVSVAIAALGPHHKNHTSRSQQLLRHGFKSIAESAGDACFEPRWVVNHKLVILIRRSTLSRFYWHFWLRLSVVKRVFNSRTCWAIKCSSSSWTVACGSHCGCECGNGIEIDSSQSVQTLLMQNAWNNGIYVLPAVMAAIGYISLNGIHVHRILQPVNQWLANGFWSLHF